MNILVFSNEFPPTIGGAGVVAAQLAESLANQGHTITVITGYQKEKPYSPKFLIKSLRCFQAFWFIRFGFFNFSKFDRIILNDSAAIYVAGLFFPKSILSRCTCVLHGTEPEYIFENPSRYMKISFYAHFYCRALKWCRKISAVSQFMKLKFENVGSIHQDIKNKVVVNYAGFNHDYFFSEIDHNFRNNLNINNSSVIIFTASRIEKMKGFGKMLEIVIKTSKTKEINWLIAGEGNFKNEFKKLCQINNISHCVHFLGKLNRKELRIFYSNSDVFLLLSEYTESFGLVYIEAAACGLPCIGYNNSGVREAIAHNISGFLINDSQEAIEIITTERYKNLYKDDILKFAKTFDANELSKHFAN